MNTNVIVGLGFGDEGKGLSTSLHCSFARKPLVVRFNGGHQAGHTVVFNGKSHVFSNFGSGTLQGVPTFWSHFCTFNPVDFYHEAKALELKTDVFVHALCPVTTPFDVYHNRNNYANRSHGTVGAGFGSTLQRNYQCVRLFVQDLPFEKVVIEKLRQISMYYNAGLENYDIIDIESFLQKCKAALSKIRIVNNYDLLNDYDAIYEGAQGIMLDQDYGFFPNVTRSNTTSKNALSLIGEGHKYTQISYITRTYQTRHGYGYMTNQDLPRPELVNNENETNVQDEYQGDFRTSILDIDLLNYAITCDNNHSHGLRKNLIVTCLDQTGFDFDVTIGGKITKINLEDLPKLLSADFKNVWYSTGQSIDDVNIIVK